MRSADSTLFSLAARQHGVISFEQAMQAGVAESTLRRRVRSGVLDRVAPAVYRVAGSPDTFRSRIVAAVMASGNIAAASHRTAAYVHGLMDRPDEIEVVASRTGRRRTDYVIHQSTDLEASHIEVVDGIPVTTPERTVIEIGVPHGLGATARCLDTGRRLGVVDLRKAASLLHELGRRGRNGVGPARTILVERLEWDQITESELEDRFLRLVQRAGLPEPTAQHMVRDQIGRIVARLDFAYPGAQIAIELDSMAFHSDQPVFRADRRRQNLLVLQGWTVLRFTWWDVLAGEIWVLDSLTSALGTRFSRN